MADGMAWFERTGKCNFRVHNVLSFVKRRGCTAALAQAKYDRKASQPAVVYSSAVSPNSSSVQALQASGCCERIVVDPPLPPAPPFAPPLRPVCHNVRPALLERAGRLAASRSIIYDASAMPWRYFTLLSCGNYQYNVTAPNGHLCLVFIEGQGMGAKQRGQVMREHYAAGMLSKDGGQTFTQSKKRPLLVAPTRWLWRNSLAQDNSSLHVSQMTHNYAIHRFNGSLFVLVGGIFNELGTGVYGTEGRSWHFAAGYDMHVSARAFMPGRWFDVPTQWQRMRKLLDGTHAGCYEAPVDGRQLRFSKAGQAACVFDGRLSLVHFRGRYLLYARMNPVRVGQRFVQMAMSKRSIDGVLPDQWMPFRPISIQGYAREGGNLYFFSVCVNPIRPDSLLALTPAVHNGVACVAISLSRDGIRWSSLQPLVSCATDLEREGAIAQLARLKSMATFVGHRSTSHPVANVLVWEDNILLFIHEEVPGISDKGPARLVRYAIPCAKFVSWTESTLNTGSRGWR